MVVSKITGLYKKGKRDVKGVKRVQVDNRIDEGCKKWCSKMVRKAPLVPLIYIYIKKVVPPS